MSTTNIGKYQLTVIEGEAITDHVQAIATLRLKVFREYPYLYDGDREYEENYLRTLASSKGAAVVLAGTEGKTVGASTCLPLCDAEEAFQEPFERPQDYFYLAESVLLSSHRGNGLGHHFFDLRERVAKKQGFELACFCAVVRSPDHPRRPAGYHDLKSFWRRRGYQPLSGHICYFPWKDLDDNEESLKALQFWAAPLAR
jgi:GNAT superfamily N-acetyltransferase